MIDEELYQLASDELNSDQRRPDIWARACALASDDHDEARYLYTNLRVEQLLVERAKPRHARSTVPTGSTRPPASTWEDNEPTSALDSQTRDTFADDSTIVRADEFDADSTLALDDASLLAELDGQEALDATVVQLPDDDDEAAGSSTAWIAEDVSPRDVTTHDFQTDDLTPDDYSATTIDMPQLDDAAGAANLEHSAEEPGHPLPEAEVSDDGASAGSDSSNRSHRDDDDFSFELEPLQPPADDQQGDVVDSGSTAPDDSAGETRSTRSGIDSASPSRLTESDMAGFGTDSPMNGSDEDEPETDRARSVEADERAELERSSTDRQAASSLAGAASIDEPDDGFDRTAREPVDLPADNGSANDESVHDESALDGSAFDESPVAEPTADESAVARSSQSEFTVDKAGSARPDLRQAAPENDRNGRSWLVYRRKPGELRAVKQGVSWPAMIATLPWLLGKLLLGTAVVYTLLWLVLVTGLLVSGLAWLDAGAAAPPLTLLLFASFALLALFGLFYVPFRHANGWHARKLERRGFSMLRQVNARNATAAVDQVQAFVNR